MMTLFLIVFFTIYTAMHLLAIWGCYPLLSGHAALPLLAGIWTLLMVVAPAATRLFDNNGHDLAARGLAWVGYCWMGFVFYAFCFSALLALWELLLRITALAYAPASGLSLYGPQTALLIVLFTLLLGCYGFYEARDLRIEHIDIATARLPAGMPQLKVAQVSDLHLGLLLREGELGQVVALLRELKPDLLVATGDIVDAQISHLEQLVALWRQFEPPLGKFAVTGNHEAYAGLAQALAFLHDCGFVVLRDRTQQVAPGIVLAGIDDPAAAREPGDERGVLGQMPHDALRIFLKHRPRVERSSLGLFDLQLSGHSHRGQLMPFNLLTGLEFPLQNGFHQLEKGSALYASRGTGTWGPPMRVGSPPEITLITFHARGVAPAD